MDENTLTPEVLSGGAGPLLIRRGCDPREIAHFNAQAESEGEGARRWLHRYNPLRLTFVETVAVQAGLTEPSRGLRGLRLLDVGCGTGIFCEALARTGAEVRGIDPAPATVAVAAADVPAGLDLRYASGVVGEEPGCYDIVTAMEVIEHVPDPVEFLRDCVPRVRPGGILVLSTISRTWQSYVYAILMAERVLRLLPRGAHEWRRFVRPEEIETALQAQGFHRLDCWGATMDLRSRLMKRSRSRGVNFLIAMQRSP